MSIVQQWSIGWDDFGVDDRCLQHFRRKLPFEEVDVERVDVLCISKLISLIGKSDLVYRYTMHDSLRGLTYVVGVETPNGCCIRYFAHYI